MLPDSITALAGAIAAIGAKVSLFPMDTIKTRLQAPGGISAHGGFRGIYKGVGAIAAGSPPLGNSIRSMKWLMCRRGVFLGIRPM